MLWTDRQRRNGPVIDEVTVGEFATLLRRFRERAGLSCNELARAVGVDPSYISRLERSEREPPRRRVVAGLASALQLDLDDQDRLLVSAGYAPATVALLGHWDSTPQVVAGDARARRANWLAILCQQAPEPTRRSGA